MDPPNPSPATTPAPQSFATYLLIAWLTSNIIFAQIVNIVSALEWEVRRLKEAGCRHTTPSAACPTPPALACVLYPATPPIPLLAEQVCDQAPETVYGSIVADKVNSDTDLAQVGVGGGPQSMVVPSQTAPRLLSRHCTARQGSAADQPAASSG